MDRRAAAQRPKHGAPGRNRGLETVVGVSRIQPIRICRKCLSGQCPPVPAPLAPVGGYNPPPATNNMAVTGLIMGCLSVVCCQFLGILGIVFSAIGRSQLKSNPGQAGRGMAIAGLILSLLSFIILGLFLAFGVFSSLLQQLSR